MDNGLVSMLTHWLFGLPPDQVRYVHVCLALVMSSMVWGPPLARLYWHVRRERFLLRATPEQLAAYLKEPPKPPSIGGPAAMMLGFVLASALLRAPHPVSTVGASVVPSAPTETPTMTAPRSGGEPDDGLACFPPRESSQDEGEESKTCCKGRCEPGSRCNTRTCECEARAVSPSSTMRFIDVASPFLIEAGSALAPTDWEPSSLPDGLP